MKKFTIYALVVFAFSSCMEEKKDQTKATSRDLPHSKIQINVKFDAHEEKQEVNLNFVDGFNDTKSFVISKQDTVQHNFAISSDQPVFLMDWTINQVYYVLYPNEKITIQAVTNKQRFLTINSSTPNQIRKNELSFFQSLSLAERTDASERINKILGEQNQRVGRTGELRAELLLFIELAKFRNSKNTDDAYRFIKDRFDKRINFLKKYKSEHPVSDRFYQLASKLFQFDYESAAFEILKKAITKNRKIGKELNEFSAEKMTSDSVNWLFIPTYQRKLSNYLSYAYLKYNLNTVDEKLSFINKTFTGDNRSFCIFMLLKKQDAALDPSSQLKIQQAFGNTGKKYLDYIKKNQEFYISAGKNLTSKHTQLQSFMGIKTNFADIINAQKDKVIVLDFWASWCQPCKADMPFSKQLHEEFKAKKVAFVYLSLDKNYNNWYSDAKLLKLEESSYIVSAGFTSKLAEDLKIKTIPRYVLIDKKGVMVDLDAPRPSDPVLKKMIERLLNAMPSK